MYILISIETNDIRHNEMCSKNKSKLKKYLKGRGFYWSRSVKRYIDDMTSGIRGGSGVDYIIEEIEEITQLQEVL